MKIICSFIIVVFLLDQVNDNKAFVFYFTHPDRRKDKPASKNFFEDKRSVIQLAESTYINGKINCDRDQPVTINLKTK